MSDEKSEKYAWRGTLYFIPPTMVPWWQLPTEQAIDYYFEIQGIDSAKFTVITAIGKWSAFCTMNRIDDLCEVTRQSMVDRGLLTDEEGNALEREDKT